MRIAEQHFRAAHIEFAGYDVFHDFTFPISLFFTSALRLAANLDIRRCQLESKPAIFNFKDQAAHFVIISQLTEIRIICRIICQPVFEIGVAV
ncbi:hypothetical protein SDC9_91791 [bioreactor metagenome]|uniref:Uncharacterized protein n=1 Tax=bioreactor metagenome TaxID=1076179 RepID=A0A644ZWL8_9ZZZZ